MLPCKGERDETRQHVVDTHRDSPEFDWSDGGAGAAGGATGGGAAGGAIGGAGGGGALRSSSSAGVCSLLARNLSISSRNLSFSSSDSLVQRVR